MPNAIFTIEADPSAIDRAFAQFADVLAREIHTLALDTGHRIAADATARVRRRTGETARGIAVSEASTGDVLVTASRQQFPLLPAWLEYGTGEAKRGRNKGRAGMVAHPFFGPSVKQEAPSYVRNVTDVVERVIGELGLGD